MKICVANMGPPWPCPLVPTPALWIFRKDFSARLDGVPGGLCLASGRCANPDTLTVNKFTVSAFVKAYVFETMILFAVFDNLTEKTLNHPYTCARAGARTWLCVCHVVRLSVIYIYTYISYTYLFDRTLTGFDSDGVGHLGQGRFRNSLRGGAKRTGRVLGAC